MKIVLQKFKKEEDKLVAEETEYQIPFVPAGAFLEYLEIEEEIEDLNNLKPSEVKILVDLIVKTFDNQFTVEDFFKGVPGYLLMSTLDKFILSLNTNPHASKSQSFNGNGEEDTEKKAV